MSDSLKKAISVAIATGTIVTGSFVASDKLNCDYELEFQGEKICLSKKERDVINSEFKVINVGFGGVRFSGK